MCCIEILSWSFGLSSLFNIIETNRMFIVKSLRVVRVFKLPKLLIFKLVHYVLVGEVRAFRIFGKTKFIHNLFSQQLKQDVSVLAFKNLGEPLVCSAAFNPQLCVLIDGVFDLILV